MALGHERQEVAGEVDAAALMAGALQHPAQGSDQPGVLVGDDQAHPGEATAAQRAQKAPPERFVFAVAHVEAEDFAFAGGGDAGGDHHGHRRHLPGGVADVEVGGVQVEVGELEVIQAAGPERSDELVEAGADT